MRHKHADMIIEWAETGKSVQYRYDDSYIWHDVIGSPLWLSTSEYRFKPKLIKYKRFLHPNMECRVNRICVLMEGEYMDEVFTNYVKWIDTEWQEVEL